MNLKIMTPAKVIFEGEVEEVSLPGVNGEFGVLRDHAEMISSLSTGICRYTRKGGESDRIMVSLGACHISNNEIKVLTQFAEYKNEIDPSKAKESLAEIEQKLISAGLAEDERTYLESARAREQTRLELLS